MQREVQQFSSAPQAVGPRKKYRDPDELSASRKGNMMHDKRVVRGNTYASLVAPQQDMAEVQKQREAQRRRLMRASQTKKRPGTPEPVAGRRHMDIQTESYLEELTERTVEFEAETQTDFLLDRPPSPLFMPAKIGVDVDTQIEEGDLFDFDVECEPVLEVLVGKTLEQSMMEVLEEEELESLRRHQEEFEKRRNAEMLEVQRMEAAEKRRSDEMERRMQQQAAQRKADISMMKKVVSRSIAAAHLGSLQERTLKHLLDAGTFADSTQLGVETHFLPTLLQMVSQQMAGMAEHRQLLDGAMRDAVAKRLDAHGQKIQAERQRLAEIDEAERQERIKKAEEEAARRAEQEAMEALDYRVPTPPPPPEEYQVMQMDEAAQTVLLADGQVARVPEGRFQELAELLAQVQEGLMVVCTLVDPLALGAAPQQQDGPPEDDAAEEAEAAAPPAEDAAAPAEGAEGGAEPKLPELAEFRLVEAKPPADAEAPAEA